MVNSDKQELADVLIKDGLIVAVGQGLQVSDLRGAYIRACAGTAWSTLHAISCCLQKLLCQDFVNVAL